jgi:hypothetical protein
MAIDYARMQRVFPKQKAALTRAKKIGYSKVLAVVVAAITEWNEIGAWPDDWRIFQNAIIDAANKHTRDTGVYVNAPRMENL